MATLGNQAKIVLGHEETRNTTESILPNTCYSRVAGVHENIAYVLCNIHSKFMAINPLIILITQIAQCATLSNQA